MAEARRRTPPPMDHEPGWKESAFTEEMGRLILQRILGGETVKEITADPRMPSYATVYHWARVIPEFGQAWRETRALRARIEREAEDLDRAAIARAKAEAAAAAGRPVRWWRAGQKTTYTPERAAAVCEAIRGGAALSEVVARPDMPTFKAVYGWLRRFPEFREQYGQACDFREGWIEFQTPMIAETTNAANFRQNRAQVAAMEGRAGRMRPRKHRLR